MPKCTPCISEDIKDLIREGTKHPRVLAALEKIPSCPVKSDIQLCEKAKRMPSAYQEFIGKCMREKPIAGQPFGTASKFIKECAADWRKFKEQGQNV